MSTNDTIKPAPLPERLAYNLAELKAVTGLSTTTVWRLEKRGFLSPVAGIRSKLYSRAVVEAFLNGNTRALVAGRVMQ